MFVTGQVLDREPTEDFPQVHLLLSKHQVLRLIQDLARRMLKRNKEKFVVSFYGMVNPGDFRNEIIHLRIIDVERASHV